MSFRKKTFFFGRIVFDESGGWVVELEVVRVIFGAVESFFLRFGVLLVKGIIYVGYFSEFYV